MISWNFSYGYQNLLGSQVSKLENRSKPIAVIDSGVGGISVLRELVEIMPHEDYIYFGDSANAPYGTRDKSDVLNITRANLEMLKDIGIKALVIACNTATSVAVKILREENPDLIIVGIEPAIKPPALLYDHPTVLVMATPLTLKEEKFLSLMAKYADRETIIPLPCPRLAELIESGELDSPEIDKYVRELLSPYREQKIDALVLGCTHYPHVKDVIMRHVSPTVRIFDGGEGTAQETRRRLESAGLLRSGEDCGRVKFLNSSDDERLIELSKKLLCRQ